MTNEHEKDIYNRSLFVDVFENNIYIEESKICVLSTMVAYCALFIGLVMWGLMNGVPPVIMLLGASLIPLVPIAPVIAVLYLKTREMQRSHAVRLREYRGSF